MLLDKSIIHDLIISDYRLPNNKNGLEAILLLQDEFNKDIPSFIITGDASKTIIKETEKSGIEVLQKPLSTESLHHIITQKVALSTE